MNNSKEKTRQARFQNTSNPTSDLRQESGGRGLTGAGAVISGGRIRYEVSGRAEGLCWGGLGLMRQLADDLGLAEAIDREVQVLERHLPYRESDHVLSLVFSLLSGGRCLQDVEMTLARYKRWADQATEGLERAAKFLHSQKIFRAKDLPYRTQIVPLASIFTDLSLESEHDGVRRRIARWFWCGVLGELYGGGIESRFARDLPEVVEMIREDREPTTIQDANFAPSRLLSLRTRNSAAYKGIYALLMKNGCLDFRTGEPIEAQTFHDERIDIHHIFPQKWCRTQGIDYRTYNSIVNKTAISARTNRQIGGQAPSDYLNGLQRRAEISRERMDEILASHQIVSRSLWLDDFHEFFQTRTQELLDLISEAMGKTISREEDLVDDSTPQDEYEDEHADWEDGDSLFGVAMAE